MTNSPIKDKKKQSNDFNINKFDLQTAHFTKNTNKRYRGSNDIQFETGNKVTPLRMENEYYYYYFYFIFIKKRNFLSFLQKYLQK